MAYMSQEMKQKIVARCKPILAKYDVKASFKVDNHTQIVVTLKSGSMDWDKYRNEVPTYNGDWAKADLRNADGEYQFQVNHYHIDRHWNGTAAKFLNELEAAINADNHDNSRIEIDHFDVGYYVSINVGKWNKPYILT